MLCNSVNICHFAQLGCAANNFAQLRCAANNFAQLRCAANNLAARGCLSSCAAARARSLEGTLPIAADTIKLNRFQLHNVLNSKQTKITKIPLTDKDH